MVFHAFDFGYDYRTVSIETCRNLPPQMKCLRKQTKSTAGLDAYQRGSGVSFLCVCVSACECVCVCVCQCVCTMHRPCIWLLTWLAWSMQVWDTTGYKFVLAADQHTDRTTRFLHPRWNDSESPSTMRNKGKRDPVDLHLSPQFNPRWQWLVSQAVLGHERIGNWLWTLYHTCISLRFDHGTTSRLWWTRIPHL